ncbi:MAG: Tom37 metaxin N-terminal-like domain-containing protein, partial [Phenylobacterium sp.]
MIVLYCFGPLWGLPDPSPFVVKTAVQLKMSGVAFRTDKSRPPEAPKGKLPFIEDNGVRIGDSVFIREHLERKYGIDLDAGLDARQRAHAWAVERVLEDHLYWATVYGRWAVKDNFDKGPAIFFG